MRKWASAAVIACGLALMAAGWMSGEARIVLEKAARVCLECIGVG